MTRAVGTFKPCIITNSCKDNPHTQTNMHTHDTPTLSHSALLTRTHILGLGLYASEAIPESPHPSLVKLLWHCSFLSFHSLQFIITYSFVCTIFKVCGHSWTIRFKESEPFVHCNHRHGACTMLGRYQSVNKFENAEDAQMRGHSQRNTFLSRDHNSRPKS